MPDINTVAHVIQLAVAPVFLLTGVGAILSVLVNRLGRIVDRFRVLERSLPGAADEVARSEEMGALAHREKVIYWSISLCVLCALLICVVVAALFVSSVLNVELSALIASLFILAMLALIAGLLSFLREIQIATGTMHRAVK
ncbi:MAG TPA: DUF2721 domain-containing protein [Gallionellaceae bacterium]|nr:DUF2721 domain-containing protein [Gallionellaceae bacterium]